jgi:hypothetical protein
MIYEPISAERREVERSVSKEIERTNSYRIKEMGGMSATRTIYEKGNDILFVDYAPFPEIDGYVQERNKERFFPGSVRINRGYYRTKSEEDEYIKNSLARELP